MGGRGNTAQRNSESSERPYRKVFKGSNDQLTAVVKEFKPLNTWTGQYMVDFIALGNMDNDYRGTYGTGMKVYDTEKQAIAAAKRYVKRWEEK